MFSAGRMHAEDTAVLACLVAAQYANILDTCLDRCRFCFEGLELGCKDHCQTPAVGHCRYVLVSTYGRIIFSL